MNKLQRIVRRINRLPTPIRPWVLTRAFGHTIPFTATAGVRILDLSSSQAVLQLPNRRRARNHIGSVHAAAAALLAESASGIVLAMHVPDHCLPLLKSMQVEYTRRAQGALTARATLDSASRARIREQPQGELDVPVTMHDESGQTPMQARMLWAWVPRRD